ncbi:hypothetical protein [Paenibacillus sanguinis]|uniref:hypothetical protein n=1 Tax=Paenibacillus sanguinis TaxID=225906 RepID=UPI000361476A|nr:hypothetical protein [Paenibacillus sanguinis]
MKKLLLSVVLGFTLFPLSVMAQQVPAEIQEAAEKSLLDKAPVILADGNFQVQTLNESETLALSEGYPYYIINAVDTYDTKDPNDFAEFAGYIFPINKGEQNIGVGMTSALDNDVSLSDISDDLQFEEGINKAIDLLGYTEDSFVFYDRQYTTYALASKTDEGYMVTPIRKGYYLEGFEVGEVYPLEKLTALIQEIAASRENVPSDSGGGSPIVMMNAKNLDHQSSRIASTESYIVIAAVLLSFGIFLIYRHNKNKMKA